MWVFPLDGATLWYKAKKIDSNFTYLVLFKVKFREPRGYELMISPLYRGLKQFKKKNHDYYSTNKHNTPCNRISRRCLFFKIYF
jgi:hypothetical protein